jgi:hypothetical protein
LPPQRSGLPPPQAALIKFSDGAQEEPNLHFLLSFYQNWV